MRYSNARASRNQRRPAEISVNAEKSVLRKKCQKMVRCQACVAKLNGLAIGNRYKKKPAAAGQAFPRADDLSLFSVRTRPDAIDADIAYKLTMMLMDCSEESVHGLAG